MYSDSPPLVYSAISFVFEFHEKGFLIGEQNYYVISKSVVQDRVGQLIKLAGNEHPSLLDGWADKAPELGKGKVENTATDGYSQIVAVEVKEQKLHAWWSKGGRVTHTLIFQSALKTMLGVRTWPQHVKFLQTYKDLDDFKKKIVKLAGDRQTFPLWDYIQSWDSFKRSAVMKMFRNDTELFKLMESVRLSIRQSRTNRVPGLSRKSGDEETDEAAEKEVERLRDVETIHLLVKEYNQQYPAHPSPISITGGLSDVLDLPHPARTLGSPFTLKKVRASLSIANSYTSAIL